MNQDRTPLIDALAAFSDANRAYFNIPGHRGTRGVDPRLLELLGAQAFEADRTETAGLDDLHAPEGVILTAQELAADLYGSAHCRFVVNGTTAANEAMILAAVRPGERILVPRSAHKSVLMGLVLGGAVPVWYMPERDPETGLYGAVSASVIGEALERDPSVRAVFLLSPTYYGIASDIQEIARIAHAQDIPLLVDEAHGAHFAFHEALPLDAVSAGADLVAQSTHKTPGSLTQSAMLHCSGTRVDLQRLDDALKLVQSTSPSYLLMASLDGARHMMATGGRRLQERAMQLTEQMRGGLRAIPGIRVFQTDDLCRVVFSPCGAGLSGTELLSRLFLDHITAELADMRCVVAIVTHGNTEGEVLRFCEAVRRTVGEQREGKRPAEPDAGGLTASSPPMRMTPRTAWFANKRAVRLEESCGMTAGEAVTPYPPGIPLVYPGEEITEDLIRTLLSLRTSGVQIHDAADPSLRTIRVISPGDAAADAIS